MVCPLSDIRSGFLAHVTVPPCACHLFIIPTGALVDIGTSLLCTVLRFGCPGNTKD